MVSTGMFLHLQIERRTTGVTPLLKKVSYMQHVETLRWQSKMSIIIDIATIQAEQTSISWDVLLLEN